MGPHDLPAPDISGLERWLRDLNLPDQDIIKAVYSRQDNLTKPPGSLGRLEEIVTRVALAQKQAHPRAKNIHVHIYAGNHGVANHPVSAFPAAVTAQMVTNFSAGGAAINQLCRSHHLCLRVQALDLDNPVNDFSQQPAMNAEECWQAMTIGAQQVHRQSIDILCLGEMGIGNTTSASALCLALFGGKAQDWAGPGTGIDDAGVQTKATIIAQGVKRHPNASPFQALACFGGREMAAIVGAIIAARMNQTAVILDGFVCTAAAACLHAIDPKALSHCMVGHCSQELGHRRLLDRLGMEAILDLNMRLGEGSGAALAAPIVRSAIDCYNGMATFAEAAVINKRSFP